MTEDDGPGRKKKVSDKEILQTFKNSQQPVLTASDIANDLPIKRRGIFNRLQKLEQQNKIQSRKIGGKTTIWWLPGHTQTENKNNSN